VTKTQYFDMRVRVVRRMAEIVSAFEAARMLRLYTELASLEDSLKTMDRCAVAMAEQGTWEGVALQ